MIIKKTRTLTMMFCIKVTPRIVFMQATGSDLSSPIARTPVIRRPTKMPSAYDIPISAVAVARYSSGNHKLAIKLIPLSDIGVANTNTTVPTYKGATF